VAQTTPSGPSFDFQTLGAVGNLLLSTSVITGFSQFFETPGTRADKLLAALKQPFPPQPAWIRDTRWEVISSMLSIPRLLLSLFFLGLIGGIFALVIIGPDKVLDSTYGPLAEPLSIPERVIYGVLQVPPIAAYIWRIAVPYGKGCKAIYRGTRWLWRNDKKGKKKP
jgi:hypothetical protein